MAIESKLPGAEDEKIYGVLGFWVEALLYGGYFILFVQAVRGMVGRWKQTSKVFFIGIWIMFIATTIVTAFQGYTLTHAFAMELPQGQSTVRVLHAFNSWDMFGRILLVNLVVWVADILAIYRCYIIWGRNRYVLVFPIALVLTSMGTAFYMFHWWLHPELKYLTPTALIFVRLCFPLSLAQNLITTGLILFKIWRQYRESRASGLMDSTGNGVTSLMTVVSVVIESAAMYTLLMLALAIQVQSRHRFGIILQCAVAPVTSMIFVLLSVRMDAVRNRKKERSAVFPSLFQSAPVMFARPVTDSTSDSYDTRSVAMIESKNLDHRETTMKDEVDSKMVSSLA